MEEERLYHDLYFMLFNRMTDAIRAIDRNAPNQAREILCRAQQDAEERYLNGAEE